MQTNESVTPWLIPYGSPRQARVRLFCFPYAGGAAHVFREWPRRLPQDVQLFAVQLPGRGGRLRERPFTGAGELVVAAAQALRPFMTRPFVFFGHSMGALISYELARLLQAEGRPVPSRLFISGCPAPQTAEKRDLTYNLPEREFIEELRRLKGTPPEVLANPELLQLMLPMLRDDFAVTQTYRHQEGPPLWSPFTVFGGLDDEEAKREDLLMWRGLTTGDFTLQMLPGDHFFLNTSRPILLEIIARQLARLREDEA